MSGIDLTGLTSPYGEYINQTADNTKADKLTSVAKKDFSGADDKELMDACKKFEAYFLEQVFKEMVKTIPKPENQDASTSNLVDFFKDNTIQKLAEQSTENNSTGLAKQLYEQMKRNIGDTEI